MSAFVVYVCRDETGQIVYVGQSGRFEERQREQLRHYATCDVVAEASDREQALAMEAVLIRALAPAANVHHIPKPTLARRHRTRIDPKVLTRLRNEHGMTQVGVARRTGINYSVICKLELGIRHGTPQQIKALADLFGVPVESLHLREAVA